MKKSPLYSLLIISFLGPFSFSVSATNCENALSGEPTVANKWIAMKKKLIEEKADPNETHIPDFANQIPGHLEHISKLIESLPNKSERQRAKRTLTTLEQEASKKVSEGNVTYRWWIEFNFALLQLLNPPNVPSYTLGNTNKIIESFPNALFLPVTYTREEIGEITAINKLHDNRIFPFRLPNNTRLHEVNELAGMSRELRNLDPNPRATHIDFFDARFPKELTIPVPPDPSSPFAFRLHDIAHRDFVAKEQGPIRTRTQEEQEATRVQAQIIEQITQRAQNIPDRKKRESIELIFFILMYNLKLYTRDFRTNADIIQYAKENSETIVHIYMEQIRQNLAISRPATREEAEKAINDFIEIASQVE